MLSKKRIIIFAILTTIVLFVVSYIAYLKQGEIQLTQLSDQTQRQMMGYVIHTKDNKTIVIDGGTEGDADNLIKYINNYGGKVDAWFVTHLHIDHMGALSKIIEETKIPIESIYVSMNDISWYELNDSTRIEDVNIFLNATKNSRLSENTLKDVSLNQVIKIDRLNFEILGIRNEEITKNAGNNSSVVIKLFVNNKSILFLGDLGVEGGEKLLKQQGDKVKSDMVQMAHHGQNGVDKVVYERIQPKACLWPTPDWLWNNDSGEGANSGTWKTLEVRKWIEELGVKKNYIEKDGDITLNIW